MFRSILGILGNYWTGAQEIWDACGTEMPNIAGLIKGLASAAPDGRIRACFRDGLGRLALLPKRPSVADYRGITRLMRASPDSPRQWGKVAVNATGLIVEVAQVVVLEGHEPDALLDLPDADLLAGEDLAQIHLPPLVADLSAGGHGGRPIVEGIVERR